MLLHALQSKQQSVCMSHLKSDDHNRAGLGAAVVAAIDQGKA